MQQQSKKKDQSSSENQNLRMLEENGNAIASLQRQTAQMDESVRLALEETQQRFEDEEDDIAMLKEANRAKSIRMKGLRNEIALLQVQMARMEQSVVGAQEETQQRLEEVEASTRVSTPEESPEKKRPSKFKYRYRYRPDH
mmetsp:Transcript_12649/g.21040  ORF Transcript_12649/g.21040 Transcript_12649/m.21040 type:complete len:141 (+) Transcript_12649:2-424(+)